MSVSDHTAERRGRSAGAQSADGRSTDRQAKSQSARSSHSSPVPPRQRPLEGAASGLEFPLVEAVESVIIPRLQLYLGAEGAAAIERLLEGQTPEFPFISSFGQLIVSADSRDAFRFVEMLLERGVTTEAILLNLMAPVARSMGMMWETDLCNFVDVTVGLARIQQMMRQVRRPYPSELTGAAYKGTILLVPTPGEQHTFGLKIVEEFLLKDGFDVECQLRAGVDDITAAVTENSYDIIGFSVGGIRLIEPLRSIISLVRHHSLNRSIKVMIGGVILGDHSDLVSSVGADACITDVHEAVSLANTWIDSAQSAPSSQPAL